MREKMILTHQDGSVTGGISNITMAQCKLTDSRDKWNLENQIAMAGCIDAPEEVAAGSSWAFKSEGAMGIVRVYATGTISRR